MTYALNPGISFCRIDDRFVVLDLIGDRYFCLEGAAEQGFRRFTERAPAALTPSDDGDALVGLGILHTTLEATPITACPAPPEAARILAPLEMPIAIGPLARTAVRLLTARATLKLLGLNAVIAPLAAIKRRRRLETAHPGRLRSAIAPVQHLDRWLTPLDQCVPRSVTIMRCCLAADIDATLVIGVKLRPFAAHCWAQQGEMLLAEQLDTVRLYTPILVI